MPESETIHYVYVLLRADLTPAAQRVQIGHACLEAAWQFERPAGLVHLIILAVPDERALQDAADRLRGEGIGVYMFWEPDDSLGNTALATEPLIGDRRQLLRRYPMWRQEV